MTATLPAKAKATAISLFVSNEKEIPLEAMKDSIENQNPSILVRCFPPTQELLLEVGPTVYKRDTSVSVNNMAIYLPYHDKGDFSFISHRGNEVSAITMPDQQITIATMVQDKDVLQERDFVRGLKMLHPHNLMVVAHSFYPRSIFHINLVPDERDNTLKPVEEGYFQLFRK